MAIYNTRNVKELPQLEEVIDGNYLIIENEVGTNIIDFADFVVGPNNVSFYNVVEKLSSDMVSVSAAVDTAVQTSSAIVMDAVLTKVDTLTANYPRYFTVYPDKLMVVLGLNSGKTQFNSEIASIVASDINVIPTNDAAGKMSWVLLLSSIQNPGNPPDPTPYTYTITISSSTAAIANAEFDTKVLSFY